MKLQIKKSALLQYILIYLMLVFNGTNLYQQIDINAPSILNLIQVFIISIFFLYFLKHKFKGPSVYPLSIVILLLLFVLFVRYNVGGVGIRVLLEYSSHIFLVFLAIIVDKDKFLDRLVKTIYFFAFISVVCYVIQIVSPSVLQKVLKSYASIFHKSHWVGGTMSSKNMRVWGVLFFSMREGEMQRNIGIFTEPANYQIVLNAAIFILLFFRKYLHYTESYIKRYFFIISLTLITCRSTSGYIVYFALIVGYILSHSERKTQKTMKRNIILIIILGVVLLAADYFMNGDQSILYLVAFSKMFNATGGIDLNVSSGYYRMVTIESCINTMITHPLGVGFDRAQEIIKNVNDGAAGGALFYFGAALGVIPFLSVLFWTNIPVIKAKVLNGVTKIVYTFMFIEISMAQSKVFYPLLIAIPLCLYILENTIFLNKKIMRNFRY